MSTKRKTHSAKFKAQIVLEAYKGDKTAAELISTHKISSGQISTWKTLVITVFGEARRTAIPPRLMANL